MPYNSIPIRILICFLIIITVILDVKTSAAPHFLDRTVEKQQLNSTELVIKTLAVQTATRKSIEILSKTSSTDILTPEQLTAVKIMMYLSAGYIISFCMLTSVVNTIFNEFSKPRLFEVYQEVGIAILFVFQGAFTYSIDSKELCVATQLIIMFFITFICSIFVIKILFGACLIRNTIQHLTTFHWTIAFVLPLLVACISTIGGYFSTSDYFGLQSPHCFVHTRTKQIWAFVIPLWILFLCLNIINLYSFTMCKLTKLENSDLNQLYWGFKTCKVTSFLFVLVSTAYFSLMFAEDMQIVWLHCVYFVVSLLLGPTIFISHTFTHAQTCISLFALTSLPFFKPCPPPLETKHEEQFGVMFSLRIKSQHFTQAPPNTAEDFILPNAIQYSENVMEQILIIETPPLLRANKSKRQQLLNI